MRRSTLRSLAPDLALSLLVVGYVAALSGYGSPDANGWRLLAWAQYPLCLVLAVLGLRAAAAESAVGAARARVIAGTAGAVFLVSLAARLGDPCFWDAATTWARASLVRDGGPAAHGERFSLFYYFVAGLQALSGGAVAGVRLGAGLAAAAGLAGVGVLARRHGSGTAALAAALLALTTPALFALGHWLYIDMFLLAEGVWLLVLCDSLLRRPRRWGPAAVVAVAAASLLTKEYAVLVIPACVALRRVHGLPLVPLPAHDRRRLVLPALAVAAAAGWGLWKFYLVFWRGLFPVDGPSWGAWPLVIIPGNPHIAAADQARLALDLFGQGLVQTAGTGLLGFALLGLVRVRAGHRVAAGLVLAGAGVLAAWPVLQLEPAPLNRLWLYGPALANLAPAVLAVLAAMRLAGWLEPRVTRWQGVMLIGACTSLVFFALVAKVTLVDGRLTGFLDWRYPLFACLFLAVLAGEGVARLLALGRAHGHAALAAACLAPALLVGANLVAGTNYVRRVAAYTGDQGLGVRQAIVMAKERGTGVLTTWPYWYPGVDRVLDYGPHRWRSEGVALSFIGAHDFTRPSDLVLLFDSRLDEAFAVQAQRAGAVRFGRTVRTLEPLRPRVRSEDSPTVHVVDLAAPWLLPPFAPHRDEFAAPAAGGFDAWTGLGQPEVWDGGLTVRWSVAGRTATLLGPAPASPVQVSLRAMPLAGIDDQQVDLLVNGTSLGSLPLPAGWHTLTWQVPATALSTAAPNELAFVPKHQARAPNDSRHLGIALDHLTHTPMP